MQIKIRDDARQRYVTEHMIAGGGWSGSDEWKAILERFAGKVLEVETEFLFQDQFNTTPFDIGEPLIERHWSGQAKKKMLKCFESTNKNGARIMEGSVEYVIGDIRDGMMRCQWCGKTNPSEDICPDCNKGSHLYHLRQWKSVSYCIHCNEYIFDRLKTCENCGSTLRIAEADTREARIQYKNRKRNGELRWQ